MPSLRYQHDIRLLLELYPIRFVPSECLARWNTMMMSVLQLADTVRSHMYTSAESSNGRGSTFLGQRSWPVELLK